MKQVIILRTDIRMGKGKAVAQGSHAAVKASFLAYHNFPKYFEKWEKLGSKKIVCKISSEQELLVIYRDAKDMGLPCAIINDAGHTQLPPGTTTAVAVGPAPEDKIDVFTKDLGLY